MENLVKLWPRMRSILFPYEGAASQVYVLDVPQRELERTLNAFCSRSKLSLISCLDGYSFEEGKQLECNIANRVDVVNAVSESIVLGTFCGEKHIQFWIWPDTSKGRFTAEFVFFVDNVFDLSASDKKHIEAFKEIYSLAEMVRENNQDCECVLSGSEVGDPREEREKDWTVFW